MPSPRSSFEGGAELSRWSGRLVLECHGAHIGIQCDHSGDCVQLVRCLPPGWQQTTEHAERWVSLSRNAETGRFRLLAGEQEVATGGSPDELLATLESVLHLEVALGAPHRLFVHAGAVGWHGRVLILPGRSRSGKSTLVEALIREGATYFSDEYAVLDSQGKVHPYARALSIRVAGSDTPRRVRAEELGSPSAIGPWPVGLIAAMTYRPRAGWQPRRLTSGEALLAMLSNTVVARLRPSFALDILAAAVAATPALSGSRGEATDSAARLLEFMDRASPSVPV